MLLHMLYSKIKLYLDLKEANFVEDLPNKVYHDIYEQHSTNEQVFRIPDQCNKTIFKYQIIK
jgi:hypothetical protein